MSTRTKLPGIELLGLQYDVLGYYADARSVYMLSPLFQFNFSSYNPDSDPNPGRITLYQNDYYFPTTLTAISIQNSTLTSQNTKSATELQVNINAQVEGSGWYEGFRGSMQASFTANYRNSASFYSLVQMGMIQSYHVDLPGINDLKTKWLTPQASADINGTMNPDDLVAKYGAFFLQSGIFGGTLNYSQSISRFSVNKQSDAAAKVSANYMGFINGSLSTGVKVDTISDTTQSNGVFESKGGQPSMLQQGYESWADSLSEKGEFALVGFEKNSLQPLSVLANNATRAKAIQDAIARAVSILPPNLDTLQWDWSKNASFYPNGSSSNSNQAYVTLGDTYEVVVGVACSCTSSTVTKLALRVLNLGSNQITWRTSDGKPFNATDYQRIADIPASTPNRAVAVTGCGFTCTSGKISAINLYYQLLDPADDNSHPIFLNDTVYTLYSGDSAHQGKANEVSFKPDGGVGKIITGIALHVSSDNFTMMKLWQAPLYAVSMSGPAAKEATREVEVAAEAVAIA
jgi:hypothetical protein